ncbi:MAG: HsdR family type I site-specific deoxyribonuclease, partial [Bacteroidota bacterium]
EREGGIVWHTQGSGKSLTMVWLAKWIRENVTNGRALIITDRTELDQQIEQVFEGVGETVHRTKSGADLVATLDRPTPWLICSLVHKFGAGVEDDGDQTAAEFVREIQAALPADFSAKGELFVFVDEAHRTQSGKLNRAMRAVLPEATFIGFTGTPLLKKDKATTVETFGPYIHTYKFDQAVRDGVVLDLRYEARDIDQEVTSQQKVDQWFEAKTRGLSDLARAELKRKWGTMRKVLSSRSRLEKIVADVLFDMETRDRLMSGRGNALLVSASIYQACKYYELFSQTHLAGRCAIVTSYKPAPSDIKGEETGEGMTEKLRQYEIYRRMLAAHFGQDEETAMGRVEEFERDVKRRFVKDPAQMKLLIVVDKLLTGFDAPPATYLYIDKAMRDHGLFQAICRVNRLDGDDKEHGYVIDYKDLFQSLEGAIADYTGGALDAYDRDDVAGLLKDRLEQGREQLDAALDAVRALCEPVAPPQDTPAHLHYFCAADTADKDALKENEPRRVALYKHVAALIRAYTALANDMAEAGYSDTEAADIKAEVAHYEAVRQEVKLASGDYIDTKVLEPAMRHLLDAYIRADEGTTVSTFDDATLLDLISREGVDAVRAMLPEGLASSDEAMAEAIENNVRRVIVDERDVNPAYYDRMSEVLDALIEERRSRARDYADYLAGLTDLARRVQHPQQAVTYPSELDTPAQKALYDNLGGDAALAVRIDEAVRATRKHGWRGNRPKEREVMRAIHEALVGYEVEVADVFELVKAQRDY